MYHSTLGLRVIKKKRHEEDEVAPKPETCHPERRTRNTKYETRNPKHETKNQKP